MKKIVCLILLVVSVFSYAQNYYWYRDKKINLTPTSNRFIISTQRIPSISKNAVVDWRKADTYISLNRENAWYAVIDSSYLSSIDKNNIIYSIPTYINSSNSSEAYPSHLFYVKLNRSEDFDILSEYASEHNVSIEYHSEYLPLWYVLSSISSEKNALELANLFHDSGLFAASEPDFWGDNDAFCVNDTYFPQQWNLKNTGQYGNTYNGIDIHYCDARSVIPSHSDIIIAVLDQGIQLDHPDLAVNIVVDSYDTDSHSSPSVVSGKHGTACAGIIGAIYNNNIGISGIASNCKLMSISNSLVGTYASRYNRAEGISYASSHNASIISNSWGSTEQLTVIDDAISNALNYGRNGKGCVIVFASGNNDSNSVSYPANSNGSIIAVGAISPCGERKDSTSCDGETWWGSNYGNELDIMAPGVLIPTTDITGYGGYSYLTDPLDYYMSFNGTSSACPHVAAVAGLILSVNPYLTQKQVADIIESTAQKVGEYAYNDTIGRPNVTWHREMGYGLIDAYAAVLEAKNRYPIQGPDEICDGDTAKYYLIHPLQQGETVAWTTYSGMNLSPVFSIVGSSTQDTVYVRCQYIDSRLLDPIDPRKYLSATITNTTTGTSDTYIKILSQAHSEVPTISASNTSTLWFSQTPRTFTVTNCNDVPDSLLQWTVIRKGTTPPPPLHPTIHTYNYYGRTLTYSPPSPPSISRPDTLTIYATNLAGVCGAVNSNSMRFVVTPRKFNLKGNIEGQQLNVSICEDREDAQSMMAQLDEDSNYTLELWHSIYGAMRVQTVYNANEQMSISGLQQGVYVLSLKENGIIIAQTKVQIE